MITDVPSAIGERISGDLGVELINFSFVSGGCINHGGKLQTFKENYFIKWNEAARFPKMFEAEAKGLNLLRSTNTIRIPEVLLVAEIDSYQFIMLEWIENSTPNKIFWEILGEQLAALHQRHGNFFGLDHDNFIGSLPQMNAQNKSWIEFFISQRLQPQLELLKADPALNKRFDVLYRKLSQLLPEERPSLLHGDLWRGNLITNTKGPCLIDPAVYYGNREAELAFTQLFGGFDPSFYWSYQDVFPLVNGFEDRVDLYNLYPLLVHANLFGGSYFTQVREIVDRFV